MSDGGARSKPATADGSTIMTTPIREAGLFLALVYALAVVVALGLPESELAPILTVLTPLLGVAVVSVTIVRRGNRKALLGGTGTATSRASMVACRHVRSPGDYRPGLSGGDGASASPNCQRQDPWRAGSAPTASIS